MSEYIKYRQKQWEKKWQREAELEAEKEAEKEAKMVAEARKQEEIAARKKLLQEQREAERLRQKHIQGKEKLAEQKWNGQLNVLLAQIKSRAQKDDKLEEIRFIIQNREPSLQALDWTSWLSDPFNQRLADLDFEHAMEMFKRDNLMAKRRHGTRGKKKLDYALSFTGNMTGGSDYVSTEFNPITYGLQDGFTVSYWVRPAEFGNHMFAIGRRHNSQTNQRFTFGLNTATKAYIGVGNRKEHTFSHGMDGRDGRTTWSGNPYGIWYHWVITFSGGSGGTLNVYRDSALVHGPQTDHSWTVTTDDTPIYFGARNVKGSGYNNGWACALDEVAIYNTVKDSGWVANVYNRGTDEYNHRGQSGLVGYWRFNEGDGTTVEDLSGEGNHGTFGAISGDTTAYPTWEIKT